MKLARIFACTFSYSFFIKISKAALFALTKNSGQFFSRRHARILFLSSFAALLFSNNSFANVRNGFFFEPFATIEYSAPKFYGNSNAKHFGTDSIDSQIKNFDNIALGFHGRVHKYFGLNVNWSQTSLTTNKIDDVQLSAKNNLSLDYYNVSALFFAPLAENRIFEMFGEAGFSSIKSKISIFENNGNFTKKQTRETKPFVGFGFQYKPFKASNDAIRFSFQRQIGKLDLVDAALTTVRLGYIKSF